MQNSALQGTLYITITTPHGDTYAGTYVGTSQSRKVIR